MRKVELLIRGWAVVLVALSLVVTIPLTIKTFWEGGGMLGFGMVDLPILLPLSTYVLFSLAGFIKQSVNQWKAFIIAHIVTFLTGIVSFYFFSLYPPVFLLIPFVLAFVGIIDKVRYRYYLLAMIILPVIADVMLLLWEIDAGHSIPVFYFFGKMQKSIPEN